VLVVDDNRDAAESLAMLLSTTGADVHVAHDGPTALAEFELREPDVVLLDIGMPDMDGYEVARRLRESSSPQRVALVALTGWGQDEDRRRVRDAGFDHHLVKPVDLTSLQALLTELARARAARTKSA
jgi:CheY-like chemotaxis protein